MRKFTKAIEKLIGEHRLSILVLILMISVAGAAAGYRYYKYTQEDTQFCATCHLMQDAYESWRMSEHWDVKCQVCHKLTMMEQNRLLVTYVAKGRTSPTGEHAHGRIEPWNACRECHITHISQGSVSLRKSYGHARHVFMEEIGCQQCHSGDMHYFEPQVVKCRGCHSKKLVHGLGMEGLSCLNCHAYGDSSGGKMVTSNKCLVCHSNLDTSGPMARLQCFDCHKPHDKIKLESPDCLGQCHGNESQVGQHNLHMTRVNLGCLDCHKAHGWVVGQEQARGLCDRCHPLKDPRTFIY